MKPLLTLAFCALALTACRPEADEPPAPAEPAAAPEPAATPAPAGFSGDMNVIGTEPFWAVDIRAQALKLQRPDHETIEVANPGPVQEGGSFVWRSGPLTVTLTEATCSDGMSDRVYPYAAAVEVDGEGLSGCAAPAGADLGPPP